MSCFEVRARVKQRADSHIPADARKSMEIADLHALETPLSHENPAAFSRLSDIFPGGVKNQERVAALDSPRATRFARLRELQPLEGCPKITMVRIRWFDPKLESRVMPLPWPYAVLITAALFLNFPFWYESSFLWLPGPPVQVACVLGAGALLITSLFFVAPASGVSPGKASIV